MGRVDIVDIGTAKRAEGREPGAACDHVVRAEDHFAEPPGCIANELGQGDARHSALQGRHQLDAAGERRVLNLHPSPADRLVMVPAPRRTIPASEIRPFDNWPTPLAIKDQGPYGACNSFASAMVNEFATWQTGQPHVPLSGWWPYGMLVHGHDVGSNILQALELMREYGCGTESDVAYGDFSGRYPPAVNAHALGFRVEVAARHEIGLAKMMIEHLASVARQNGVNLLRLETGIHQHEAIGLYERVGFALIPPFGPYPVDPLSRCYEKRIGEEEAGEG